MIFKVFSFEKTNQNKLLRKNIIFNKKGNSMKNNNNLNLREKYKDIFNISEEDYQKAPTYYNTYLEIFNNLVDNNKNKDELKEDIEKSNPWKTSNSSSNKYKFKSLAVSDREILERLLILNIDELNQKGKIEVESIIESRFDDFEHAFDGNFINPKVIFLGINPKMVSNHKPYGLKNTVYTEPFDEKRPVLNHSDDDFNKDYYFKKSGFFYTKKVPENIRKKHIELSTKQDRVTPFALLEVFPYASEKEDEWQKGYNISNSIKPYFNLKKILPSQIWLICLLTYAIKYSKKLFLYLRINNSAFRNNFLNPYFKELKLESNKHIQVLTKINGQNQFFSKNNIKPYELNSKEPAKLEVRIDSEKNFFEDIWGISPNQN